MSEGTVSLILTAIIALGTVVLFMSLRSQNKKDREEKIQEKLNKERMEGIREERERQMEANIQKALVLVENEKSRAQREQQMASNIDGLGAKVRTLVTDMETHKSENGKEITAIQLNLKDISNDMKTMSKDISHIAESVDLLMEKPPRVARSKLGN